MVIKNNIREMLKEVNKSNTEFAKELGISKQAMSNIINMKRNPSSVTLLKIAKALDKPVEKIFSL